MSRIKKAYQSFFAGLSVLTLLSAPAVMSKDSNQFSQGSTGSSSGSTSSSSTTIPDDESSITAKQNGYSGGQSAATQTVNYAAGANTYSTYLSLENGYLVDSPSNTGVAFINPSQPAYLNSSYFDSNGNQVGHITFGDFVGLSGALSSNTYYFRSAGNLAELTGKPWSTIAVRNGIPDQFCPDRYFQWRIQIPYNPSSPVYRFSPVYAVQIFAHTATINGTVRGSDGSAQADAVVTIDNKSGVSSNSPLGQYSVYLPRIKASTSTLSLSAAKSGFSTHQEQYALPSCSSLVNNFNVTSKDITLIRPVSTTTTTTTTGTGSTTSIATPTPKAGTTTQPTTTATPASTPTPTPEGTPAPPTAPVTPTESQPISLAQVSLVTSNESGDLIVEALDASAGSIVLSQNKTLKLTGKTLLPHQTVHITIFSQPHFYNTTSDDQGNWEFTVDPTAAGLDSGDHTVTAQVEKEDGSLSETVTLAVFSYVAPTVEALQTAATNPAESSPEFIATLIASIVALSCIFALFIYYRSSTGVRYL